MFEAWLLTIAVGMPVTGTPRTDPYVPNSHTAPKWVSDVTQIAMGVLQATVNVLDFDMRMTEAVNAPRFSATSNAIDVSKRISHAVTAEMAQ